jgi:hypothetical protein
VVRDLALWPPYRAARSILQETMVPAGRNGADPEAPADLLPKSGVYPTERVFYRKLLIDVVPQAQDAVNPGFKDFTATVTYFTGSLTFDLPGNPSG